MGNWDRYNREDARLKILVELASVQAQRLADERLLMVLDAWGFAKSLDWVRQQMRHLAEVDGVTVEANGPALVACLARGGLYHLQRRAFLEGVAKPGPGDLAESVMDAGGALLAEALKGRG